MPACPDAASPRPHANQLTEMLAARIRANGPITFAEFMEACLYHPQFGYYTRAEQPHMRDYYTSVDVHPIFGRLLARQLEEMWRITGRPDQFWVVECGAGSGRLALHIVDFVARTFPDFARAMRYVMVERSAARRSLTNAAQAMEHEPAAGPVATAREKMPERIPVGCVLSNELVDALPVHRVMQREHGLQELFVGWQDGHFVDCELKPSTPRLAEYFAAQGIALPVGAQAEVSLAACDWISRAGKALERGFVLTIDYGHEAQELYNERHMRGTLLAYHEHRATEDYYALPGQQDLTAHVNFTALDLFGRRAGLRRLGLVSQSHFLMALGAANEFADLYHEGMSEAERVRARLQLKNLIHPEGMGERFSVLVQTKGFEGANLRGLQGF